MLLYLIDSYTSFPLTAWKLLGCWHIIEIYSFSPGHLNVPYFMLREFRLCYPLQSHLVHYSNNYGTYSA